MAGPKKHYVFTQNDGRHIYIDKLAYEYLRRRARDYCSLNNSVGTSLQGRQAFDAMLTKIPSWRKRLLFVWKTLKNNLVANGQLREYVVYPGSKNCAFLKFCRSYRGENHLPVKASISRVGVENTTLPSAPDGGTPFLFPFQKSSRAPMSSPADGLPAFVRPKKPSPKQRAVGSALDKRATMDDVHLNFLRSLQNTQVSTYLHDTLVPLTPSVALLAGE